MICKYFGVNIGLKNLWNPKNNLPPRVCMCALYSVCTPFGPCYFLIFVARQQDPRKSRSKLTGDTNGLGVCAPDTTWLWHWEIWKRLTYLQGGEFSYQSTALNSKSIEFHQLIYSEKCSRGFSQGDFHKNTVFAHDKIKFAIILTSDLQLPSSMKWRASECFNLARCFF